MVLFKWIIINLIFIIYTDFEVIIFKFNFANSKLIKINQIAFIIVIIELFFKKALP